MQSVYCHILFWINILENNMQTPLLNILNIPTCSLWSIATSVPSDKRKDIKTLVKRMKKNAQFASSVYFPQVASKTHGHSLMCTKNKID